MEIFKALKQQLRTLAYFRPEKGESKKFYVFQNTMITIVYMVFLTTTSLYFFFEAVVFHEYAESFFFASTAVLVWNSHIQLAWVKTKMTKHFVTLENFIQNRVNDNDVKSIYLETNKTTEAWMKPINLIAGRIFPSILIFVPFISSLIRYYLSGDAETSLILPYMASLPYNWKNLPAYVMSVMWQYMTLLYVNGFYITILEMLVGFCLYITDFAMDTKRKLDTFNELVMDKGNLISRKRLIEIKVEFCRIIQFHADSKQFAYNFSSTYSAVIITGLSYFTISTCSCLLQINMVLDSGTIVDASPMIIVLGFVLFYLFGFCYFGDNVTNAFLSIDASIFSCGWYKLPIQMQNYLPMMILTAQKPIYLHGFAKVNCTREVFKQIVNAGFSYFMILRGVD